MGPLPGQRKRKRGERGTGRRRGKGRELSWESNPERGTLTESPGRAGGRAVPA